mmetsp:Transcript_48080/g.54480  ORF Transcript_48080/g.54480 Transcript_48080/m.54480 type:complete len:357 (+) Transcript_48080:241-1311(+)
MMRSFKFITILPITAVAAVVVPSLPTTISVITPWGTPTPTTMSVLEFRGGGLFGYGSGSGSTSTMNMKKKNRKKNKSNAQIYRESLEEQVMLLDEELRQARTEMTTFKERVREQGKIDNLTRNRINISNRKQQQEEKEAEKENKRQKREKEKEEKRLEQKRQKEQQEALDMLQEEISQLEQMKSELEILLQTSANRIEELEQELMSQENKSIEMEESYQTQILELETELSSVQTTQLQKLTELHQTKIDVAVQEAVRVQEIEFCQKLEETTTCLGKDHAKEMEKEKVRSHKAVETERKKMRKLVRALALREKNLRLRHPSLLLSSSSSSSSSLLCVDVFFFLTDVASQSILIAAVL